MRIGQGIDVHAFGPKPPDGGLANLVLGGVLARYHSPLEGHSDADVVLHALVDALLGAAGLGDIGQMFPSSDEQWRGVSSKRLVALAYDRVRGSGFHALNVDVTIVAQYLRMAPLIPKMREVLGELLTLDVSAVSVKATTSDKLGFTGRDEGIAAFAVVLLDSTITTANQPARHESESE
jgi:2-C-methyl-D-erythritol 2,4-cyclodiphosphate synthase